MAEALPSSHAPEAVEPPRRFDRWLHRLYFHGAGFQHFFSRRLRPAGMGLGLVIILAGCLAAGHQRISVRQLLTFSVGMVVVAGPWAMTRGGRIEARRDLPKFGTAGEPLTYRVRVRNVGPRRLSRASIADTPPDPRPSEMDFCYLREPGEEERNAFDRKLAYFRWQWLLLGNRRFTGGASRADLDLQRNQQDTLDIELTPLRRGIIRLDDLRLLLPDPLGMFQRCRKVKAPPALLTVLPRRYPLPPIELPGGAAFKISGEANTNTIGTSGEFVGLRDYQPGDPLRLIHWPSWARTGKPIVKELEDTYYPRYGLIVDTLATNGTDREFEEVISVAASFAAAIDTRDCLLDLMFIKDEAHIVTAGRGVERAEKLLEVLAGATAERVPHYEELARLVLRHRDDLTSCMVIFNGWDSTRAAFLRQLDRAGIVCVPLVVGRGTRNPGAPGYWLESGQVARDLMKLPTRLASAS